MGEDKKDKETGSHSCCGKAKKDFGGCCKTARPPANDSTPAPKPCACNGGGCKPKAP